jgi:hypothetical protein
MLSVFSPVNILRFLPHHLVMFSCIFHFPLYVVRRHHVIVRQSALVQKKKKKNEKRTRKKKNYCEKDGYCPRKCQPSKLLMVYCPRAASDRSDRIMFFFQSDSRLKRKVLLSVLFFCLHSSSHQRPIVHIRSSLRCCKKKTTTTGFLVLVLALLLLTVSLYPTCLLASVLCLSALNLTPNSERSTRRTRVNCT